MKNSNLLPGITFTDQTPIIAIISTTAIVIAISIFSLLQGWLTIFQNFFYFPIIISCVFYLKRGFVFSVFLAFLYLGMILSVSRDPVVLEGALIRVIIFILVAGVITYLSMIRIHAEEALLDSERKLTQIIDFLPDPTFAINTSGVVVAWNRAMEEITGVKAMEIVGKGDYEHSLPLYGKRKPMLADLALVTGGQGPNDNPLIRREGDMLVADAIGAHPMGRDVILWAKASPVYDMNGNVSGVIESIRDVTALKKAEEALAESETQYRSVIENASEGIVAAQDGVLKYANPKALEMIQSTLEKITDKPFVTFIHPDDRSLVADRYMRRLRGENVPSKYDFRILGEKGLLTWVQISAVVTLWEGKPATLNFLTDISDRKQAEDALRRANRQLNLLGSITRHDILNKVMVILGHLAIARKKSSDSTMGTSIEKLEAAVRAIGSQIEFTRVYGDLGTHEPQWQDLDKILPRLQLPDTITTDVDVKGVTVYADPMFEKVFFNLLDNSIRHGQRVTHIHVSWDRKGEEILVIWEDDGVGVPDEDKERIFDRGFGKNTGLGLYLVREILSLTGITIQENGAAGNGVRFEITLPNGAYRVQNGD
ncbi:MAG: PAS domain S-box protein [Methanomicrobiales archaeon]